MYVRAFEHGQRERERGRRVVRWPTLENVLCLLAGCFSSRCLSSFYSFCKAMTLPPSLSLSRARRQTPFRRGETKLLLFLVGGERDTSVPRLVQAKACVYVCASVGFFFHFVTAIYSLLKQA